MCKVDVQMASVKSGFLSGGFCLGLGDYDRRRNVVTASLVVEFVDREQKVYASSELGAQTKV